MNDQAGCMRKVNKGCCSKQRNADDQRERRTDSKQREARSHRDLTPRARLHILFAFLRHSVRRGFKLKILGETKGVELFSFVV